jgi:hypothetical protein
MFLNSAKLPRMPQSNHFGAFYRLLKRQASSQSIGLEMAHWQEQESNRNYVQDSYTILANQSAPTYIFPTDELPKGFTGIHVHQVFPSTATH